MNSIGEVLSSSLFHRSTDMYLAHTIKVVLNE